MNDEWSRCPICFEDYSSVHRPTTFVCGHSTCIDHAVGSKRLLYCPICRHPLTQREEYHVSYNLEEASRLFQLIKSTIDWSTVKLPSAVDVNNVQNSTLEMIHRDEIYARQLQAELNRDTANEPRRSPQAELNRETVNEPRQRTRVPRENRALPIQEITRGSTASGLNASSGHLKGCGHCCDLVSTNECCVCSDRRPNLPNNRYGEYVDGRGVLNRVGRNRYYCPPCKSR